MIATELLSMIGRRHFLAEIRTETAKQAIGVIEALTRGGIVVFEISTAIPGWDEILHHYAANSEILVGAGGVLDGRMATEAARAGARFVATPILAPDVVTACQEQRITAILGALTPTEIIAAQRAGAEMVKVFPVSSLGGPQYIRSLFRHLTHLSIMVSGGVTIETLPEYLALPVRALALSSTLTPRALVERQDWASIAMIARQYVEYVMAWEASGGAPLPAASERPMLPDTVMGPAPEMPPYSPQPNAPSRPASTPPVPSAPSAPSSFKPWDSRPAPPGTGDDWIR
jgi:2-dehydro-3-deoxyphosphogluconate aldolase/(4S)-4-hydroxy-2-oxoglutarate aldolase